MAEKTGISWTNSTWTPVQAIRKDNGKRGCACVKVSPGCKLCYSETIQLRNLPSHGTGLEFTVLNMAKVDIVLNEDMLDQPFKWRKPRMIFVCSQTDLFGEFVPDEMIAAVFLVMAMNPNHTFQVLTKRADRMLQWTTTPDARCTFIKPKGRNQDWTAVNALSGFKWPLPNVWLGISAENQEWADWRMDFLRRTPAAERFVSFEPLLGPVQANMNGISWSILGGESGHGARPCRVQWLESLIDQCRDAGVACFVKQLGVNPRWAGAKSSPIEPARGKCDNPLEWPESLRVQQFPGDHNAK